LSVDGGYLVDAGKGGGRGEGFGDCSGVGDGNGVGAGGRVHEVPEAGVDVVHWLIVLADLGKRSTVIGHARDRTVGVDALSGHCAHDEDGV
jgi:hypothetical protein